jgi:ribonuclease P protein component
LERKTWQKDMRLRRPVEFRQVWATGRSWAHPLFILWALPNDLGKVRIGITASRKVGKAVARNRARRLLREAARRLYVCIVNGWDIVLVARAPLLAAGEPQVEAALEQSLRRAALWTPREITERE